MSSAQIMFHEPRRLSAAELDLLEHRAGEHAVTSWRQEEMLDLIGSLRDAYNELGPAG